ncbi:Bromodomain-containing protein [Vigna angularis]|uniref:Bromodomain-containing protein n=1 Tax=Phaseolus angularis TaxID=3914 RepID=A0A8T0K4L1_PHAAN|nr:Bromodomain-containing protein [Vigna angularis]
MEQVVQIIRRSNGHLKHDGDDIELDIEAVDTETLWELDRTLSSEMVPRHTAVPPGETHREKPSWRYHPCTTTTTSVGAPQPR